MKRYLWIFVFLFLSSICHAETVVLKSGKIIKGKITEDTEEFIKLETTEGKSLYFYKKTIKSVKTDNGGLLSEVVSPQVSSKTGLLNYLHKGYMVYVPRKISFASPAPILICLPGKLPSGYGVPAKQDINMWTYPAEKNGMIAVDLELEYNSIRSPSDVKDLYYRIKKIIDFLSTYYPIDKQKLYIAGTSGGGILSISLALMFPDKFNAVGVVGGARLGYWARDHLTNAEGSHFYMVHGQNDRIIPISEFYSTKRHLVDNGAIVKFSIFPEGGHILRSQAYKEVADWLSKVK